MAIVPQSPLFLSTLLPAVPVFPLLAAPPKRLALPAPRKPEKQEKRVVSATIANPLRLIDDPRERWAEFERIYGRDRSREEMDAELDAIIPGYTAYMRTRMQQINQNKHGVKELEAAS